MGQVGEKKRDILSLVGVRRAEGTGQCAARRLDFEDDIPISVEAFLFVHVKPRRRGAARRLLRFGSQETYELGLEPL